MRIVTYNLNGLRARLVPPRTLLSFLDSLNSDIICLQETKITRQELTGDIAIAEGYESFFSCTRTVSKGRVGYSGVATFCRTSTAVPLAADEGFTGLLHTNRFGEIEGGKARVGCYEEVLNTGNLSKQELLQLDREGRCLVTDHGSFVLFNIYGPCVGPDDDERYDFKLKFYQALQNRWEGLLKAGRRVIAVGDFNISPFPVDSCNPGPDFDKSSIRQWFQSQLRDGGGPFLDVFRVIHPNREEAYTCWNQKSGAEEFNYGSRIDLIIAAGTCFHQATEVEEDTAEGINHHFGTCEVEDCDILQQFKRFKADSLPRRGGEKYEKLEGSDHVPVFVQLRPQPPLEQHDVPLLAARFMPELRGRQQSIVSLLQKRPAGSQFLDLCETKLKTSPPTAALGTKKKKVALGTNKKKVALGTNKKKVEVTQQKNLRSFFMAPAIAAAKGKENAENVNIVKSQTSTEQNTPDEVENSSSQIETTPLSTSQAANEDPWSPSTVERNCFETSSNLAAKTEWQRIQSMMKKVPLCSGHNEPCVARIVKKLGPNFGRTFHCCARAQGPASNPEARCDFFEWNAPTKGQGKRLS